MHEQPGLFDVPTPAVAVPPRIPYAPMTGIPGVAWIPVEVAVEQVLARSRRARRAAG